MPANDPTPFAYHNPIRRLIRTFFVLAVIFTVMGVPALLGVIHLNRSETRDGAIASTCLVVAAITLPGAGAMILSGLLTIPNALKADRCFESFRRHDCLTEWIYTDVEWRRYVQSEQRRLRKVGWAAAGFVGAVCLALGLVIVWSASSAWHGRLIGMSIVAASALAVAGIILASNGLYIIARVRRLTSCPRAFLGRQSIFCGGDFAYWGSNMLVLRSARLIDGETPQLEFIVGTGGAAANVARVADMVNTLAGHPTGASRMTWRYTVLVPEGRMAEAQTALRTILEPPSGKAPALPASRHATPVSVSSHRLDPETPLPSPKSGGVAKVWWWATVGLALVGLGMFLVSGNVKGQVATGTAVAGFLMWCATPITLIVAVILSVSRRRWKD